MYLKYLPLKLKISMKYFLFIFLLLIVQPALSQSFFNPAMASSANLDSPATKQYLAGNNESLALYQKAIIRSQNEYGKNSKVTADLYYQLGIRAFWLSQFDLAEAALKRSVDINPNSEAAQLMLINVLRFRNQNAEAYFYIQRGLKKNLNSLALHKDLVLCLQDAAPLKATQQAFVTSCLQDGMPERAKHIRSVTTAAKTPQKAADEKDKEKKEKSVKKTSSQNKSNVQKSAATKQQPAKGKQNKAEIKSAAKAVYEPIAPQKAQSPVKVKTAHRSNRQTHTNKLPLGLVPPPPVMDIPAIPVVPQSLRAHAARMKPEKSEHAQEPRSAVEEVPKKHEVERQSSDSDPDFLIEWANVKKKAHSK